MPSVTQLARGAVRSYTQATCSGAHASNHPTVWPLWPLPKETRFVVTHVHLPLLSAYSLLQVSPMLTLFTLLTTLANRYYSLHFILSIKMQLTK